MFSFIKSVISGIGTGAGVAWPSYGIACAVLGVSTGSSLSFLLGAGAVSLFLAVSIPVFHFSYREEIKSKVRQTFLLNRNRIKLEQGIARYLNQIYQEYLNQSTSPSFSDYCHQLAQKHREHTEAGIHAESFEWLLLTMILTHPPIHQNMVSEHSFKQISESIAAALSLPLKTASLSQWAIPAFFSFAGTFGTIAGCSAGVSGLLNGMGLFTTFTAFPLLGGFILTSAVICGALIARVAAQKAEKNVQAQGLIHDMKKMRHCLDSVLLQHSFKFKATVFYEALNPFWTQQKQDQKQKQPQPSASAFSPDSYKAADYFFLFRFWTSNKPKTDKSLLSRELALVTTAKKKGTVSFNY